MAKTFSPAGHEAVAKLLQARSVCCAYSSHDSMCRSYITLGGQQMVYMPSRHGLFWRQLMLISQWLVCVQEHWRKNAQTVVHHTQISEAPKTVQGRPILIIWNHQSSLVQRNPWLLMTSSLGFDSSYSWLHWRAIEFVSWETSCYPILLKDKAGDIVFFCYCHQIQ